MAERRHDEGFMTATDAFIWRVERDPLMRWTISAVLLLEGTPDWDALVERYERLTRLVPRLRQRIVEPPLQTAPPRWTTDPYFDLHYHLRRIGSAPPGDMASLCEFAGAAAMGGLDRERPLWEATLVEGLAGGRSALVMKLHHSLTDGIGGVQLAAMLADPLDGSEPVEVPAPDPVDPLGTVDLWRDIGRFHLERSLSIGRELGGQVAPATRKAVLHPLRTVTDAGRFATSVLRTVRPITRTASPVMTERGFSWHFDVLEVPFDTLHDAARGAGATLNDAFVASITGGLRRYHQHHGRPVSQLRMSMPISTRTRHDGPGGNHVSVIRFAVPVDVVDPVERMRRTHEAARAARDEPVVPYTDALLALVTPLTPAAVGPMAKHMDFTASNVPGIPVQGRLCGVPVSRFFPFGPTGGAALNVTMLSYDGNCCVGVNCDTSAVPDGPVLMDHLREGFAEVAGSAASH